MATSPRPDGASENLTEEDGLDSILLAIENPVRRKIIKRLSKQPSYQLQISKELGFSQQLSRSISTLWKGPDWSHH